MEEEIPALWIGPSFREDMHNFHPLNEIVKRNTSILVIHGTDDTVVPCSRAEDYHMALLSKHIPHKVVIIPQADHTYSKKNHEERAIKASVNWFVETL